MTNWKPIETAPKDKPFLARDNGIIAVCELSSTAIGFIIFCKYMHNISPQEWCEIPE